MRNLLIILLAVISVALLGPFGGICLAAIPNKSSQSLQEAASHVVVGTVTRVYRSIEQASAEWEMTFGLVELRVERQEKGARLAQLVYVRFWTKRYTGAGMAAPGNYGFREVPQAGHAVRAYVLESEDGGLDALPPNGFEMLSGTK
jgi:hypothetical protein